MIHTCKSATSGSSFMSRLTTDKWRCVRCASLSVDFRAPPCAAELQCVCTDAKMFHVITRNGGKELSPAAPMLVLTTAAIANNEA